MFERQRSGSVVCPGCNRLVEVDAAQCPHCGRVSPGMFGYARTLQAFAGGEGFVRFVIATCALLYVVTLLVGFQGLGSGGLMRLLSPSGETIFAFGSSGWLPVFQYGRWWTPLSASWLHGSLLHILFNMMWIRQLAPALIRLFGAGRTVLIYVVAGVSGFVLTSVVGHLLPGLPRILQGAASTVGASASIFGLFGALVLYGRRTGSAALGRQVWTWAAVLFVFGLVFPGIDNWAHFGGFAGGYAAASYLDPRTPERPEHLLAALVCLALSLAAVVLSVLHYLAIR
ncbi:MAG: rhomboid family intramembrane serine protease [Acidobacteriota bacterium]|nr:rhomboid family intramembrane serine protease [Acidobacteriota bacterium]MDH3524014.1 rhomboid family intramembrane serine protease [Acidobacteriota bacterium]